MRISRPRRGTTLIELMVMSLAALMLVGVIWFLFSGGMRHFRSTDDKLKGVQGAQLLVEHLQDDLDRICWDQDHPISGAGQSGDESTVSFFVFDRDNVPKALVTHPAVEAVSYRFDADSRRVYRNDEPLRFSRFVNVRFKLRPASAKDAMNRDAKSGELPKNTLYYAISAAGDEKLERLEQEGEDAEKATDRRGITTLMGSLHVRNKVLDDQFPGWVDNGTDRPVEKN